MKKLLFILFFFSALLAPVGSVWAEEISAYYIEVKVKQSGELFITETIDYDFGSLQRHGIYRDIPFTIKRSSKITNLGVGNFSVEMDGTTVQWQELKKKSKNAGKVIRLKIGSPTSTITGKHQYKISYTVKKGVLPAAKDNGDDAVRWNVIGTGWNVPLNNIEAHFLLPDSITRSSSASSTFTGEFGSTTTKAISKWIDNHHLQVNVSSLKPYEGLTVEIAFAAGLLDQSGLENVKTSFMDNIIGNWHWAALLGFLAYFRSQFRRYAGFKDNRAIAVQYEPPKNLSLLRAGLILDKSADNEDFAAAIMELGYLGYLEIGEKENALADTLDDIPILSHFSRKLTPPILHRTDKPDDALSDDQKYLLNNILFSDAKDFELTPNSETTARKLKNGFETINKRLYDWSVKTGYLEENPNKVRTGFLGKSVALLLPVLGLSLYTLAQTYGAETVFVLIFPVVFGGVGLGMFFSSTIAGKAFGLIFAFAGMMPLFILYDKGLTISKLLIGPIGVLIFLIVVMVLVYKRLGRFTQKGADAQKKLLGLKSFITRVKQDELKRRLAEDPLYLEKLLPYAVLFGETKHWLTLFDDLNVTHPVWYHGNTSDIHHFSSSMDSASTPPSSSGGGGFSGGGGSSGGGGGGGGGGSW